ncbi:MAG: DedA family protein [Gammaproteobacteria bacterium]|nr:DedA family protein [Gammaproteobacteria bacterium]
MRPFSPLYARVMRWARHPHAPGYLAALSFAESSFFPVPPDVMLAPMVLARPERAWRLAALTTLASVLGGVLGYLIGMLAFEAIEPLLHGAGYWEGYQAVREWFARWGVYALFIAGFSPIPYKLFTIAAGVVSMAFVPFLIASAVGRGARFFLVAGLIASGGEALEQRLQAWVDWLGWAVVALALVGYLVFSR